MEYKLKYKDENEALNDLMDKGVIQDRKYEDDEGNIVVRRAPYTDITEAVVYIGKLVDQPATFDKDGEVLTDATYLDGWHVDVMTKEVVTFENAIEPKTPKHKFA